MRLQFLAVVVLAVLAGAASCDNSEEGCTKGYRPPDCVETRPSGGSLIIQVTIDGMNPRVPIAVYLGDVENNIVAFVDTLDVTFVTYYIENGDYAVKATYRATIDGSLATVYSIDGGNLSPSSTEYCDGTCYGEGSLTLDAKLSF